MGSESLPPLEVSGMSTLFTIAVAATVVMLVASIAFFLFVSLAPSVSETWADELGSEVESTDSDSRGGDRGGAGVA